MTGLALNTAVETASECPGLRGAETTGAPDALTPVPRRTVFDLSDAEFPFTSGRGLRALLTDCRTTHESLAVLARVASLPWETETSRWVALRGGYRKAQLPLNAEADLLAWALTVTTPIARTIASGTPDARGDRSPWEATHLIPARVVLSRYERSDNALERRGARAKLALERIGALGRGAPDVIYTGWRRFGLPGADTLTAYLAEWTSENRTHGDWTMAGAHPDATPEIRARAFHAMIGTRDEAVALLLSRPDALDAEVVRRVFWPVTDRYHNMTALTVPRMGPPEYGDFVRVLVDREAQGELTTAIRLGTPAQHGAIRATAEELAEWCLTFTQDDLVALQGAMAEMSVVP